MHNMHMYLHVLSPGGSMHNMHMYLHVLSPGGCTATTLLGRKHLGESKQAKTMFVQFALEPLWKVCAMGACTELV
jgi:hypothetical protein